MRPTELACEDIPDVPNRKRNLEAEQTDTLISKLGLNLFMHLERIIMEKRMDIYRELFPKVRPAIDGPYRSTINPPAWVPAVLIGVMAACALLLWGTI